MLGFGLGRFGGAVAMQNKVIEETKDFSYFYMDNYYLKTLVEMGYLGLAFFILLLFGLVLWSLRSIVPATPRATARACWRFPCSQVCAACWCTATSRISSRCRI